MTIYEEFGCNDKFELYEKILNDDPTAKPLKDYILYPNVKEVLSITELKYISHYLSNVKKLQKDNIGVMFVNTKNEPMYYASIEKNLNTIGDIIKDILYLPVNSVFLISPRNENNHFTLQTLEEKLDSFNITVKAKIQYDIKSNKVYDQYNCIEPITVKKIPYKDNQILNSKDYSEFEAYNEFLDYFLNKKYPDKTVDNIENIKEYLRLKYRNEKRELVGYIAIDKYKNIIEENIIFKGGVNASAVESLPLYRDILKNTDTYSFILFHNHPSGMITPSVYDEYLTKRIIYSSEIINIPIFDHIIIGKNEVYSFKESSKFSFQEINFNDIKKNHFIENLELTDLLKEDIIKIPEESVFGFDYQDIDDDLIR